MARKAKGEGASRQVAVVGAGLMGHGIAQVFARGGCSVKLYDINENILKTSKERIRSNLKLFVDTGFEDETVVDRVLSRMETTGNLREAVQHADFVTEAVFIEEYKKT